MLPSIKLSCINDHVTNSYCRGGDINKQITLYRWRKTIQQKKNHFEHESSLRNEYCLFLYFTSKIDKVGHVIVA